MVNPLSSALIISLWITLLIVVGGARLFEVKLNRRHALPIMTVMGAGLTLVALTESDQLPLSTMSLGKMIHILWKPALINAGAILGVYTAGICIKDYWHPPRFIEYRGKLIPTRWVIGTLATGLICMGLAWALRLVAHRFDIFLFLPIFGIGVFGKSLAIYLVRDRAKDREVIDEEE